MKNKLNYYHVVYFSERVVIFYLRFWLLIDMVNGYLMRTAFSFPGGFSLGEVSRIFFLIFILLSFRVGKNKSEILFIIVPFLLIFLSFFQHIYLGSNLVGSINIAVKICLPILIFLFVKEKLQNRKNLIVKIILINSFILVFNLVISLFGFGFFTYGSGSGPRFGGKGFFFAGNEVSIVILVTYSLLIYLYKDKPKIILLTTFIFLLISLISLTRASIFGVMLVFVASVMLYQKKYRNIILSISAVSVTAMIYILKDYIILGITRAMYFIESTSMLIFMTGGHKRWEATRDYYYQFIDSPFILFIGKGWSGSAEQDMVDLIAAFGVFGISVYLIWFYFAAYTYKNHEEKSDKLYIAFVFILVFGVATLAGHVMTSAMLAPFVAILANLHLLKNKKQPNNFLVQDKYLFANKSL